MPQSYHFCLRAMRQNRNRAGGSPGEMNLEWQIPVDGERHDVDFVYRDGGIATFEQPTKDSNDTKARFCEFRTSLYLLRDYANATADCLGTQLMLESYTPLVYVESPPTNDLPRQLDNRIAIEMSDARQRVIYLRPDDTVCLEAEYHDIKILARKTKSTEAIGATQGDQSASTNEIQVNSSVPQTAGTTSGVPQDDEDTEDDDDLDATSDTIGGPAIRETPSKPHVLPSAPDVNNAPHAIESVNSPDTSTPAARAGVQKDKRGSMQPQDDAESNIFQLLKGEKPPTKYRRTPKQKHQIATDGEIMESSDTCGMSLEPPGEDDAAIDARRGETRSSPPKRKRPMTDADDEDEDDDAIPASTAPSLKRSRGRPTKASKAANAAAKKVPAPTGRSRGRPSNASKAAQKAEDAEHASSPGKLRMPNRKSGAHKVHEDDDNSDHEEVAVIKPRRKHGLSPDLDPRSSATPQSPGTPMIGKPPNKILLSNSKFAKDTKARSWITKHGAAISDDIPGKRANFICVVGIGELATTAKVLRSLALGKKVVTDQWIEDSMKADQFLDLEGYTHDDVGETADIDRGELLKDKTLFITDPQMKAYGGGVDNIRLLATAVGAWKVESGSVKKGSSMPAADTIFIGGDGNDPDALKLTNLGRVVYQKTLLTQSVIQGELLIDDDELQWQPNQLQPTPKSGKEGKK
jgi:hypothetical protein